jgi:O-methyltransferase domain/Dimerisation domain
MSILSPIASEPADDRSLVKLTSPSESIMRFFAGHLAAKYLMAANRLGVFEALAAAPLTIESLACETRLPVRALRLLVRPLINSGLLERDGNLYRNGPVASACLCGATEPDLRPVVTMWDRVIERQWTGFAESLRSDAGTCGWDALTGEESEIFNSGIAALTNGTASMLAEVYDFSQHRSLLDLGGGMGSFLEAIGRKYPELRKTLFERPQLLEQVAMSGVELIPGDLRDDPIPGNHDVVLLANVLHLFKPAANQDLLRRIRESVGSTARLLLVDFWMNEDDQTPEFGALLAGEFLIVSGGDVYRFDQVCEWLDKTGWRYVEKRLLTGASSLIVAEPRN